jgi:hypothetical protein
MMTQHKNILGLIFFIFNSREGNYTPEQRNACGYGRGGLRCALIRSLFFLFSSHFIFTFSIDLLHYPQNEQNKLEIKSIVQRFTTRKQS